MEVFEKNSKSVSIVSTIAAQARLQWGPFSTIDEAGDDMIDKTRRIEQPRSYGQASRTQAMGTVYIYQT